MNILTGLALSASILCGDVNLNGTVTAVDALAALKLAVAGDYSIEGDVTANGVVTAVDAYAILAEDELECLDIVDVISEEPVKTMLVFIDYGDGPGFLGEGQDVACIYNENFYMSVQINHIGWEPTEEFHQGVFGYMENFIGLAAIVEPGPNPPLASGVLTTCLAYPGQTFDNVVSEDGPVTIRVR